MRETKIAQHLDSSDLGDLRENSAGENRGKGSAVLATPAMFTAGVVIGMTVTLAAGSREPVIS
ncbi:MULTISPECIES: hypothetical protein [Streptomyces]|uniref:hypothetical protein n=1 Tax=Streptomyces TaxID=1883 RepID=UPI000CD5C35B|nr:MULTISPECIES: hypothetical protein [Streptomyces]